MNSAMPKYRFKSVLDITVDDFHKMGAKAVGLDIDNTICFDGTSDFIDGLTDWLSEIQAAGIKAMIITNAVDPRAGRVAGALSLPYVCRAKKPMAGKLIKAAQMMGVDVTEMAMLGDQLFSDVKAANRCGAIAVRIDPMKGETRYPLFYKWRRFKEAPIIAEFEKNHGYGVYDE